jgi:hypothetical protein
MSALLAGMELELDNYRSALTWALTQGNDAVAGGAIAGALPWQSAGLAVECRYWVERALEVVSEAEQPHVAARLQLAWSALFSGKRSHDAAERAIQLYASSEDARGTARARRNLAHALIQMGEFDAAYAINAETLSAARAHGDARSVAASLNIQALIETARGDISRAREGYALALEAYKTLGHDASTAMVFANLAELEFGDGHPERALVAISEALEIHLRGKNAWNTAIDYVNGAAYRLALGDLAGARESAREGLRAARQGGDELLVIVALQHLALLAGLGGDGARASALLGYVDARYSELGIKRDFTERWGRDKLLLALRETLSEDEISQLSAVGADWSEDRAVERASLV